jgi:hypothetical protein
MRDNFHADSIASKQLAYLEFLTFLIHGTLGSFVGSQH